jgi:hypothetical protein
LKVINTVLFFISLLAIAILYLHLNGTINFLRNNTDEFALALGLFIPLILLFIGYVQLRDIKIYTFWLLLAIVMLLFYFQFKDFESLQMKRGSALRSFKSLLVFLILFQISRQLFIKVTGREYISPSIGGSRDIIENKKPQVPDFIMFGLLFFSIIAGQEI